VRIKDITVQGFKSFANRYTFVFPAGITAIVGPNGSGKSNVADAIRWVLGEQRHSAMRARRAEDMIFAGTERRSRSGLAQVAVTFDNVDRWLDLDFAEVEVSRRAHRDGSLQYFINGAAVRLRDVQDLLGGRLGQGNYTVIGQGMVDSALTLRPEERRGLIDEAAGLVPLQRRRERSLRQLAETRDNLTRVRDITDELGPRLQRMSRLARRAEQHQTVVGELKTLLEQWYGFHWHEALRERLSSAAEVTSHRQALEGRRVELEALRSRRQQQQADSQALEAALQAARDEREQFLRQDGEAREAAAVSRTRGESLRQRLDDLRADLSRAADALASAEHRHADRTSLVAGLERSLAESRALLAAERQAFQAVERRQQALDQRRELARQQLADATARRASQEGRIQTLEAETQALDERVATATQALSGLTTAATEREQALAAATLAAEAAEGSRTEAEAARAVADARRAEAGGAAAAAREALGSARGEVQALRSRMEGLEAQAGQLDSAAPWLERLRDAGVSGVIGSLADLLEVDSEWEPAVAAVLGQRLQAVVVADAAGMAAARRLLGDLLPGRLTLIDASAAAAGDGLRLPAGGPRCPAAPGIIDQLFGHVRFQEAEDAPADPSPDGRHGRLTVTKGGTVYQGLGLVMIGPPRGDLLRVGRERRELPGLMLAAEAGLAAAEAHLTACQAASRQADADLVAMTAALNDADSQSRLKARERAMSREAHERAARELEWARERSGRLVDEREARLAALDLAREQLAELSERERAARDDAAMVDGGQLSGELAALQARLALAEVAVSKAGQELAGGQAMAQAGQEELAVLTRGAAALQLRESALVGELEGLDREQAERERSAGGRAEALQALEADIAARLAAQERGRVALQATELAFEERRRVIEAAERELAELRVRATRAEDRLERLFDQLRGESGTLGLDLGSGQLALDARDRVALPEVDRLEPDLEARVDQLRGRLRALGYIDQEALATYEETQAHYDDLVNQEADLATADANLRQLLEQLDQDISAGFERTFALVAEAFGRYFPLLFGGGEAELVQVRGEGAAESPGLDIMARPPGKRRQPLSLLSGGERALTAVALTFALLQVSGTPFVVLDEVDAALDEANVDRFCQALKQLAEDRQVVVVTHNRGTIQTASTVYGISMAEDGASQVISLQVEAA
jgi:chromosome segregation protein